MAVEVPLQFAVREDLHFLIEEYACLLLVLQKTELPEENFNDLKLFLSGYFDDRSFKDCKSLECIIELLNIESKIYIFNIDPLIACCNRKMCQPIFENEICVTLREYKSILDMFLASKPLKDFQCSMQDEVKKHHRNDLVEVTLKLNEDICTSNVTLDKILKTIPYKVFGISSKAFVFHEVHAGCVCVTWLVPTSLVPTLREKAEQSLQDYLTSNGVLELVIGLRIVPNEGLCMICL